MKKIFTKSLPFLNFSLPFYLATGYASSLELKRDTYSIMHGLLRPTFSPGSSRAELLRSSHPEAAEKASEADNSRVNGVAKEKLAPPSATYFQTLREKIVSVATKSFSALAAVFSHLIQFVYRSEKALEEGVPPFNFQELKLQFGDLLVEQIAARYGIDSNAAALTINQCRLLLLGILVHVRVDNLRTYYDFVKNHNPAYRDFPNFDALDAQTLDRFVHEFRSQKLPLDSLQKIQLPKNLLCRKAVLEDFNIYKQFHLVDTFVWQQDQRLANSESSGHVSAYLPLEKGDIIPSKDHEGNATYRVVSGVVYGQGLTCFVTVPLKKKDGEVYDVEVLFRGTSSIQGVRRLVENGGAGHVSFDRYKPLILDAIRDSLPQGNEEIRILFSGHSLGGADAFRALTCSMEQIEETRRGCELAYLNPETPAATLQQLRSNPWNRIVSLQERIWNATGVNPDTNRRFLAAERKINAHTSRDQRVTQLFSERAQAGEQLEWDKVRIRLCEATVSGDPIQKTGAESPGHGSPLNSPTIFRERYEFNQGHGKWSSFILTFGLTGFFAHKAFNLNNQKHPYQYCSNLYAPNRLEQKSAEHFFFGVQMPAWENMKDRLGQLLFD